MTDTLEQAGASVDATAAEVKTEAAPVISHLEAFGQWTETELKAAEAWIKAKL